MQTALNYGLVIIMESKTIIVTGGSGFIGSVLCKILAEAGHNVINIDRKKKEIEGVTQYPFDIDNHQLKGVINLTNPDTIIHLAAEHEVARSMEDPAIYYGNNVSNTIQLLNHAVEAGVKNFIFSSSSSVYGDVEKYPVTEDTEGKPTSPYGRSKAIIEQILPDYEKYGISWASLRYFNVAGADPEGTSGYTQEPATHFIPILAKAVVNGEKIQINGNDYTTSDGTCERDFTHVFDIATAHLAAMNYLSDGGDSGMFNIGSNNPYSLIQVVKEMEKVSGKTIEYEFADRRTGDVVKTFANTDKAQTSFGWSPIYNIEDILTHALNWESSRKKK